MVLSKSNNIDLLNTNHLEDEHSNFSLKDFNVLHPFSERGHINIKNIDWAKKQVTYELILQGKAMGAETASFGKDATTPYTTKKKEFTFSINSQSKDNDSVMGLTLYKGSLSGVNTANYDSITLDSKMIFFNKKTVLENFIKNGENILKTLSNEKGKTVDAQAIYKAYINSGSKLSFKDWASGKDTTKTNTSDNKNTSTNTGAPTKNNIQTNNTPAPKDDTILGIPKTGFWIGVGVLVLVGGFITYKVVTRNKINKT